MGNQPSNELWTAVNNLSRAQVQELLEGYGMAVYDTENIAELRAVVVQCTVDGELDESYILSL